MCTAAAAEKKMEGEIKAMHEKLLKEEKGKK